MRLWISTLVTIICWLMISTSIQAAPIESLVLYLSFDEGEGEAVQDLSGSENHGALVGKPKWVEGKVGSALEFNGEENSNYVEVPDHPSLDADTELTCAAWIYFDEFHGTAGVISKFIGTGNQRSYGLHMHHTTPLAITAACSSDGAAGATATVVHSSGDVLEESQWQHVAMIFKAKDFLNIYVNGELIAESEGAVIDHLFDSEVPLLVGTDFDIGGVHGGNPREFTGIIDEVTIFNRALSETGSTPFNRGHRIQRLMSSLVCLDGLPLRLGGSQGGNGT